LNDDYAFVGKVRIPAHEKFQRALTMRLRTNWSAQITDADIFAVHLSADNTIFACALSDGHVALCSGATGSVRYTLEQSSHSLPVTSIRFNPRSPKSVFATSADGLLREWSTRQAIVTWTMREEENEIFAMDVADSLATAGLDKTVRVYALERRAPIQQLATTQEFGEEHPGHTSRIFSLLFHPGNANSLFSGGWDDSIQMWDLRSGIAVRSMFGAHICSDTLDICGNFLLSGSWRTKDQVQFWDLRTFTNVQTVKWSAAKPCLVYAARFHPSGDFIAVGGSGAPEVRLISTTTFRTVAEPVRYEGNVYSICFSKNGNEMIVGAQKGDLRCFQVPKQNFFITNPSLMN
jgi:WD40 repeat protein